MAKLSLADITDTRAYEREREEFRSHIIALKAKRRIHVGPFVTFLFENAETMRFQIQEMARAERILTDEGIQAELDIYNPVIPDPGNLSATMFIELTNDAELREWLPKLVGIETQVELRVGPDSQIIRCTVDPEHEKQLTRDETTAAVHYVRFELTAEQAAAVAAGPVVVAVTHPAYSHEETLNEDSRAELSADLAG